jgi:hypothetical protein
MNIDEFIALKYYLSQIAQGIYAYSYIDVIPTSTKRHWPFARVGRTLRQMNRARRHRQLKAKSTIMMDSNGSSPWRRILGFSPALFAALTGITVTAIAYTLAVQWVGIPRQFTLRARGHGSQRDRAGLYGSRPIQRDQRHLRAPGGRRTAEAYCPAFAVSAS